MNQQKCDILDTCAKYALSLRNNSYEYHTMHVGPKSPRLDRRICLERWVEADKGRLKPKVAPCLLENQTIIDANQRWERAHARPTVLNETVPEDEAQERP